ncbi:MAG: hypothetical protein QXL86_03540 [Candidatus Aenigmatarchaeota archaeon]
MEKRLIFAKGKQRELLKTALSKFKLNRKEFAKSFNIPFKTFEKWLYEERSLPKSFLASCA